MTPRRRPLIVELQLRLGSRKGAHVLAFLVAWDTARRALGSEWPAGEGISAEVEAYTSWWNASLRSGWDELAKFRVAFPDANPSDFLDRLEPVWDRSRGARALAGVVLPA